MLVRGNSATTAMPKWRRMVRNLCSFVRETGTLPHTLVLDGYEFLLETPLAILQQFDAAARSLGSSGEALGETSLARAVGANDIADFYRSRANGFTRSSLDQAPFLGLRGSIEAVCGMLRYCASELSPGGDAAHFLLGLPLLPLANGDLVTFGACSDTFIVGGPSVLGYILLGHQNPRFVHQLAAPLLRPYASDRASGDMLKLVQFSAPVLAKQLGAVLPDWYKDQPAVPWSRTSDATPSGKWIPAFWRFLVDDKCTDLSPFDVWPLIPASMFGELCLVSCRNRKCILRIRQEKVGNRIVPEKLTGRAKSVYDMLAKIGVPILDLDHSGEDAQAVLSSELLLTELGIQCFDPRVALQVLAACNGSMAVKLETLQPSDREMLLEFWQNADLTAEELEMLKRLPLFELEGGSARRFVPITGGVDQHAWYMLPEDIPRNDLRGEFLKHVPFTPLYTSLGVVPLSREKFYCEFIFADIHAKTISLADCGRHLHDIFLNFEQLVLKIPSFPDKLSSLPIVTIRSGETVVPTAVFDPEERLFQQFFSDNLPLDATPDGWTASYKDWLAFLRKAGMTLSFTRDVFLQCARRISEDATNLGRQRESDLVQYIRRRAGQLNRYALL